MGLWEDNNVLVVTLMDVKVARVFILPMALPADQTIKLVATTTVFLVWPAMFRETMARLRVWADQKDSVM